MSGDNVIMYFHFNSEFSIIRLFLIHECSFPVQWTPPISIDYLRRVCLYGVENVDEDQEDRDEERHPPGNDLNTGL